MNATPSAPPAANAFTRIISLATALGLAGMLGSLACLSSGPQGRFVVGWNLWSLPLGALGFILGIYFWRLLWQAEAETEANRPARRRLFRYSIFLGVTAFSCFIYPIRFVDPARRLEIFWGLFMAIGALSFMGWLIYQVIRWVSANDLKDGESE